MSCPLPRFEFFRPPASRVFTPKIFPQILPSFSRSFVARIFNCRRLKKKKFTAKKIFASNSTRDLVLAEFFYRSLIACVYIYRYIAAWLFGAIYVITRSYFCYRFFLLRVPITYRVKIFSKVVTSAFLLVLCMYGR